MNNQKSNTEGMGRGVLSSLGGTAILLTTVTILLYLLKYHVAAAIVGTTAALAIVGMALALTWFIASHWTIKTMSAGAEIALRSQEINDQWDAKKTASLAHLMQTGAKIGIAATPALGRPDTKMLPIPTEDLSWLPQLTNFSAPIDADYIEEQSPSHR